MASSSSPSCMLSQILKKWAERTPTNSTSDYADQLWKLDAEAREDIQSLLSEELEQVTELELQGTEVAEKEIAGLGIALQQRSFPGIVKLNLCNCRVDRRGLAELAQAIKLGNLANLRFLDLSGTCLDDVGAGEVAGMLASGNLSCLEDLHLLRTDVGDTELVAIAESLESGGVSGLRSLSIGSGKQNLILEGTTALGKSFHSMPHLEHVQMQGIVSEQAVIAVVDALSCGMVGRIKCLELSYCGIGYEGAKAIANSLESLNFASLESLDLSNNLGIWMGDEGVVTLCRALKTIFLYNLRKLVLNNVAVGEKGLLELAALLEGDDLPGLRELHVQDSGNTETSARALVKAYQANPFLVAEIFVAWPDPSYKNNSQGFRMQNLKLVPSLKVLMDEPNVPVTRAKIFLCGHPKSGKTTLKKSLSRPPGQRVTRILPKVPVCRCIPLKVEDEEDQAFEIELSRIVHKNMFLGLWDLAGKPELHLLHSPCLPHLAFATGEAILFMIVCSANYSPEMTETQAKKELNYWLRYVASNSVKVKTKGEGQRHHVLVVLNSFHGDHSCHNKINWDQELRRCQEVFDEYLDIHSVPFMVNFHNHKEVKSFKHTLSKNLRGFLRQSEPVPRICSELQQRISRWVKKPTNDKYPVLSWHDFRSKVLGTSFDHIPENYLAAATDYLHEAGQVIYFREGVLKEGGLGLHESLVILDPALFWETILGRLVTPDSMLRKGKTSLRASVHPSGALPIKALQDHFSDQLQDPAHIRQVIAMLQPLGVAYRFRSESDHIFIPALIEHDDVPPYWESHVQIGPTSSMGFCKFQWVMGFALRVTNTSATLLAPTVFRKFQMELAREQDEFGGFSSSEFFAGKNIVSFRNQEMAVVVQYRGEPINRVDILTKPMMEVEDDQVDGKESQMNLAQVILEKFELIANCTCPGVELSKRVIEPWCSEDGLTRTFESRNVEISVDEVTAMLRKGGIGVRTKMLVGKEPVFGIQVLSGKDIKDLRLSIKEECAVIEQTILHPELFALSVDPSIAMHAASLRAKDKVLADRDEDSHVTRTYTLEKFFSGRIDEAYGATGTANGRGDIKQGLNDSQEQILQREFDHLKSLGNQIQKCVRYSVAKEDSSMPRLLFLTHREDSSSGKWMKLENAVLLRQSCKIHFLCEDHAMHEVKGQEGVGLSQLNELGNKLGPLLEWTFKIAFVASKIGRKAALPGLDLLLKDGATSGSKLRSTGQLAKISLQLKSFASAASTDRLRATVTLTDCDPGGWMTSKCATSEREMASVREEVSAAFKALLANMSRAERMQRLGLKRVMLASTEKLWLCSDCYSRHGSPPEV